LGLGIQIEEQEEILVNIAQIQGELKGWTWDEDAQALFNPAFGRIQMIAVLNSDGSVNHHRPAWVETRGEITVVVNDEGSFAFVRQMRPVVIPPENYAAKWQEWSPPKGSSELLIPHPADLSPGVDCLEVPRGFSNGLLHEAEEETRFRVEQPPVAHLGVGHVNMNTTFMATSPFALLCKATRVPSDLDPDPDEPIREVLWLPPEEASEILTLDANTYALLWLVRKWALKQEDSFWGEIAERL